MQVHTKETVQALLDKSDRAVVRALKAIYALQTDQEKNAHTTREHNGVGFSAFDAPFLTDMVLSLDRYGQLTPKQMAITRNKIKRYWRQLVEIANKRESERPAAVDIQSRIDRAELVANGVPTGDDCTCENYDGERECPRCEQRKLPPQYSVSVLPMGEWA
jgi:hypothetical protein